HIADCAAKGLRVTRLPVPDSAAEGCFVAPTIIEVPSITALTDEHFGPVLHIVRFKAGELPQVVDAINATGFGLTLGLHSRI
ncbi:aldehyde dehydrogenase family protein, partial [Escherichia coli]|uniref:aldehyde dehydrogenase family protein n=1 Tax=Escherichia coli TaxID=562 RepID=UPI003CE5C4D4